MTPPTIGFSDPAFGLEGRPGAITSRLSGEPFDSRSLEAQKSFEDVLGVARGADRIGGEGRAREAAEQLVARALLEPLLARARESGWAAEPFAPTRAEKQFRSLTDAAVAEEVVRRGNFEIVARIADTLERAGGSR
ncbi:MAG: hypothetical protein ACF8Q5_07250 [Phycisphaerales bacterium JB040]